MYGHGLAHEICLDSKRSCYTQVTEAAKGFNMPVFVPFFQAQTVIASSGRRLAILRLEIPPHLTHYPSLKGRFAAVQEKFQMQLTVNGELHDMPVAISLLGLIEHFGLDPRKVAIERNLEIVPRSTYGQTQLGEGDRLEIVQFVGGG